MFANLISKFKQSKGSKPAENCFETNKNENSSKRINVAIVGTTAYMKDNRFRGLFTNRAITSIRSLRSDFFLMKAKLSVFRCFEYDIDHLYHSSAILSLLNPSRLDLLIVVGNLCTHTGLQSVDWTLNALQNYHRTFWFRIPWTISVVTSVP